MDIFDHFHGAKRRCAICGELIVPGKPAWNASLILIDNGISTLEEGRQPCEDPDIQAGDLIYDWDYTQTYPVHTSCIRRAIKEA